MSWIRLSDNFLEHPKFADLDDRAIVIWLRALAHCRQHPSTNGFVSDRTLTRLKCSARTRQVLLNPPPGYASGLWRDAPEGVVIHDFAAYGPTRDSDSGRAGGLASGISRRAKLPKLNDSRERDVRDVPNDDSNGPSSSHPLPSHPLPTQPGSFADLPPPEAESGIHETAPVRIEPRSGSGAMWHLLSESFAAGVVSVAAGWSPPSGGGPYQTLARALEARARADKPAAGFGAYGQELGARWARYCEGAPEGPHRAADWLGRGAPAAKTIGGARAFVPQARPASGRTWTPGEEANRVTRDELSGEWLPNDPEEFERYAAANPRSPAVARARKRLPAPPQETPDERPEAVPVPLPPRLRAGPD